MTSRPLPGLLLLDCDGVLIRSEKANVAYYNAIFRAFDLPEVDPRDRTAVARLHTLSTPQVIEEFFPESQRARGLAHAASVEYSLFLEYLDAEPGWVEVLSEWRVQGRTAVATNRGRSAHAVLEAVGLLPLIDRVVTVRDVERPKPHPDLLLKAAADLGFSPGESLYVGDSELDRRAAESAGMPFLGFRLEHDPCACSAPEVASYLRALAGGVRTVSLQPVPAGPGP